MLFCAFLLAAGAALFALPDEAGLSREVMTVWTDREGLPSDTILDVVQDPSGYIWLATYEGLVKFDGEAFTLMTPAETGFEGKSARVLELGPDGSLWIGTNTAGLFAYRKGAFTRYGIGEGLPDLSVRSIAFDGKGTVWVGTANGVSRKNGERFESAIPEGSPAIGIANFLLPLDDGSVVVGTNLPGLWLIGADGIAPYLADQGAAAWSFSSAFLERSGQLWLGSSSGQILRVSRNEIRDRIELEELKGSSINTFYSDPDGTLWIATDRGILSRRDSGFVFFSEDNGLPSDVVSALCRDREGSLWVGTERGGLVKFSPGKFVNISKKDGLVSEAVNGSTEDLHRSLWIATDQGVSFFPSEDDPYGKDERRTGSVDGVVSTLQGKRVRQIRSEPDGSLWFSTYSDYGLLVFLSDGTTRSITKKEGLPTNRVRFSYRTSKGALWVGTTAGPVVFDRGSVTAFGVESGLPNLFILCVFEDKVGNIWLGTDGGGLSMYDGASFRTVTTADGLAGNVVFRVFGDSGGRLWSCTSEGLSLHSGSGFITADASLGLSGESVFEALEDKGGRLWVITSRKALVVPANDLADAAERGSIAPGIRTYDRLDGLAGQLSANAWSFMNDRGIVYLPTLKGLSSYNPQSVLVNSLPPPVVIEKVVTDGKTVADLSGDLEIAAGTRRITFYYTAFSFVVPQRVRFQYKLEGYDRDWISAGVNRDIGYTNLPPGKYLFRVKAENNDGVVNEEGAALSFRKKPFFYQTIPFYVLLACLFVLSGFLAVRLRLMRLDRRARELNLLVRQRTSELAREMDKSDALLRNILPPLVAEELKETGKATPHIYENTAVLFADIVGFTPWSARISPDDIICELNDIFTHFDEIMVRWGCERIKTIGDGYLACCGLPLSEKNPAEKMVGAAIDMLRYVGERNAERGGNLEIRVGIDSGPIVGGVVGVKKYIFDVFGDTVNTAFRLQSLSVPMGLTVSEKVAREAGPQFALIERPGRMVKGKGLLSSFYVRYRDIGHEPANHEAVLFAYRKGLELEEAGKFAECRDLIGGFDHTVLEPDSGADLLNLAARIWQKLGDGERERECRSRAERFGI